MSAAPRRFWPLSMFELASTYAGRLIGEGDPSAIHIEGRHGAVLAFHGYAGTPQEVRLVTDVARDLGFAAHAPRLPGHGADATGLYSAGWREWSEAASTELIRVSDEAKSKVVVAGLSLGSLLASHLAAAFPERVAGLLVMANAIRLRLGTVGAPLLVCETLRPFGNRFCIRKLSADIRDPEARRKHLTYDVNPIAGAVEVVRAGRIVRSELSKVSCPVLAVHGALDRVCPVQNARELARRVGTRDVEVAIMQRSAHIVTVDYDRDQVAARVSSFLQSLQSSQRLQRFED
ncbi:MAG TPA: alpha/beta fold hydrolase [Polyangiaceae bacterium]